MRNRVPARVKGWDQFPETNTYTPHFLKVKNLSISPIGEKPVRADADGAFTAARRGWPGQAWP
jgi:hypothetical protein